MLKYLFITAVAFTILFPNLTFSQPQLWGTTNNGGSTFAGTIFTLDTDGNNYNLVYDWQNLNNGKKPHTGLIQANNEKLYGVTFQDGPFFGGVLYEYDYITNTYTNKHNFTDASGSLPIGPVIQATNNNLYGMTTFGGSMSFGVIYEYNLATNTYTNVFDFDNTVYGSGPHGKLLEAPNGKFYGLTGHGGTHNFGTLIEFDIITNTCVTKINLDSTNTGNHTEGSLMLHPNGKMYAMTSFGGTFNKGVIFEYDYITNIATKIHDFNGPNGAFAYGDLFLASNGKLYGMTYEGGTNNSGVIFEYDLVTNTYTVKFNFDGGVNGANPKGSFMASSNGKLYAYNSYGGLYNKGVVFEYDFIADIVTKKLDFDGSNGVYNSQNFFTEICAKPTINITSTADTICQGDSVLVYAKGTANSYNWDNGLIDSLWFSPTVGTNIYNATATNVCGTSTNSISITVNPKYEVIINDSICQGDSYTFPSGLTLPSLISSITDTSNFQSINNCDSTIITNLVVKPIYNISTTNYICENTSHTFPDGTIQFITTDITHTNSLQSSLGCDSIIESSIIVAPSYSIKDTINICYGGDYTFPDNFTQTNITNYFSHTSFLTTIHNCDSLVTITIGLDSTFNTVDTIQICEGSDYLFPDGFLQTNITNTITHLSNLTSIKGCDSLVSTTINVTAVYTASETINICNNSDYTFIDGITYSSIVLDTSHVSIISSTLVCDTIITTHLIVNDNYSATVFDTVCFGNDYIFPDGVELTNIQGNLNHQSQLTSIFGCDSNILTTVFVEQLDTSVQKIGLNLLISNSSTTSHQWINCSTNTIITGATNQSFEPSINGQYAVVVFTNHCSDTSSCITVTDLDLGIDNANTIGVNIFPNPTHSVVNFEFKDIIETGILKIYTLEGKEIQSINLNNTNHISIDLESYSSNIFIAKLFTKNTISYYKLNKI